MFESLDVRDNRVHEKLKKTYMEHEKLVGSTEQRISDTNHMIEVEVSGIYLTITL